MLLDPGRVEAEKIRFGRHPVTGLACTMDMLKPADCWHPAIGFRRRYLLERVTRPGLERWRCQNQPVFLQHR